jgi:hypothetical protein
VTSPSACQMREPFLTEASSGANPIEPPSARAAARGADTPVRPALHGAA